MITRGAVAVVAGLAGLTIGGTTVGGFPAAEDQLGSSCEVLFAPSDVELSGDPDLPPGVPAVEVTGHCEQIDELAEAAAGALAPAPGDAPRDVLEQLAQEVP